MKRHDISWSVLLGPLLVYYLRGEVRADSVPSSLLRLGAIPDTL